jgi:plasmid stabilization system protein ParE
MDWKVIFSLRSQQDLRRIVERIAKDDPAAAERFGLALIAQAESLADTPEMGVPMRERPGTRFFPHGSYLIIYRPDSAKQTVRILRFWHGARGRRPLR